MRTSNQYRFSEVPEANIPRSTFNRTHTYKTTFDSGYLIPFYVDEVLPGDTFKAKFSLFARMATPIVPIMDNLYLDTHIFYVPSRIVWDNWNKFMGEQENPGDSIDYLIPTLANSETGVETQSIYDYFGIPTGVPFTSNSPINALPLRAHNLIYREWFRDENLQDSPDVLKDDGPDPLDTYKVFRRGKRHDYFTSALPWPNKPGQFDYSDGVTIGLTGTVPVYGTGMTMGFEALNNSNVKTKYGLANVSTSGLLPYVGVLGDPIGTATSGETPKVGFSVGLTTDASKSGIVADLSGASAISINDLRTAFQVQRFLETSARSGSRLKELILGHFGVVVPDARLQRPEYLGGSSTRINIKPVEQTSSTDNTTPQGNLAAYGVVGDTFHGFTKSFVEHGYIIAYVSVRADLTYQQGLNRMWSRRDRFDFYWPTFAHLGEQAVYNREIFMDGSDTDDDVFGYQERYAEYRYHPSLITGKFRSQDPQSLDIWHVAQEFSEVPRLNGEFIEENPPIDRVIAVPSEPQFLFDSEVSLTCTRPMPVYSVPGLVDHF